MINRLHAHFHRPEDGWDPVPVEHAACYGAAEWQTVDESLLDELEQWVGGFQGKQILDLGGGPGQYSVAFAKRGAQVTWYDVSRIYRDMAQEKALQFAVADKMQFTLGYLDETPDMLPQAYDFVFNRLCWYYCLDDRSFAAVIYRMVSPGGFCYIDTTNSAYKRAQLSASARLRTWLNDTLAIKVGHPYPPRGRIARLIQAYPLKRMLLDYRSGTNERILFERPAGNS